MNLLLSLSPSLPLSVCLSVCVCVCVCALARFLNADPGLLLAEVNHTDTRFLVLFMFACVLVRYELVFERLRVEMQEAE